MGESYRPALVYYRANGLKFLKLVKFTDVSCSFLSTRLESFLGASSDSKMWLTDWNKGEGKASGQRKVTAFFPPTDNFTNGKCRL